MVRIGRIIIPDNPHHVTQRGNRNQQVFFSDGDRRLYLSLLSSFASAQGISIWAYCLMRNHVHLIAVPKTREGFVRCFQELHQAYTRTINVKFGWRGFLWQGRFASFPMDERHLVAAMRYVENNPVHARMVEKAEDYPWSSAKAHVQGLPDPVLSPCYVTDDIKDWRSFLREEDQSTWGPIRESSRTGRPLGSPEFLTELEKKVGRSLTKSKPGRKAKQQADTPSQGSELPLV